MIGGNCQGSKKQESEGHSPLKAGFVKHFFNRFQNGSLKFEWFGKHEIFIGHFGVNESLMTWK